MESTFTKSDTYFIKGLAVCLLLWHHLFYNANFFESFNNYNLPEIISYYSKVCVAIFVILSGYGLSESYNKYKHSLISFYRNHYAKIYLNYWLTWILFVPVGVILFNRTLSSVFENHIATKLILNILGIQRIFGFHGYNATWWFISLIIGLYFVFPLLYKVTNKHPILSLFASFIIMFCPKLSIGSFNPISVYSLWVFPFVVGIFSSQKNLLVFITNYKIISKYYKLAIYLILLTSIMFFRIYGFILTNEKIDTFLGMILILICFEYVSKVKYINIILTFVGTHSFNIFLFHTFIFLYYFKNFIYSFNNSILIFIVLLTICILLSIAIESTKKIIYSNLLHKNKLKVL